MKPKFILHYDVDQYGGWWWMEYEGLKGKWYVTSSLAIAVAGTWV